MQTNRFATRLQVIFAAFVLAFAAVSARADG